MLIEIVKATLVVGLLGLISGAVLAVAAKVFYIKKDEKATIISNELPSGNCGACGYSSCFGYAEAIAQKKEKADLCIVGGDDVKANIENIINTKD